MVAECSMSQRLWNSRTRFRVSCLSPTVTREGGPSTNTDPLVFFPNRTRRRKPNLSFWISRTFQTWPMQISAHRTQIYRWARRKKKVCISHSFLIIINWTDLNYAISSFLCQLEAHHKVSLCPDTEVYSFLFVCSSH